MIPISWKGSDDCHCTLIASKCWFSIIKIFKKSRTHFISNFLSSSQVLLSRRLPRNLNLRVSGRKLPSAKNVLESFRPWELLISQISSYFDEMSAQIRDHRELNFMRSNCTICAWFILSGERHGQTAIKRIIWIRLSPRWESWEGHN